VVELAVRFSSMTAGLFIALLLGVVRPALQRHRRRAR
jgi:hypothetical protein